MTDHPFDRAHAFISSRLAAYCAAVDSGEVGAVADALEGVAVTLHGGALATTRAEIEQVYEPLLARNDQVVHLPSLVALTPAGSSFDFSARYLRVDGARKLIQATGFYRGGVSFSAEGAPRWDSLSIVTDA